MNGEIPRLSDWQVDGALMFYSQGRGEAAYRHLSNFGPSPIRLAARFDPSYVFVYPDVETAFQAAKAQDRRTHDWICGAGSTPTPMQAKKRGGNRSKVTPPADWDQISPLWMLHCLRVKYRIESYRELLLGTGDRILVEDSPHDNRWGGFDRRSGRYRGQNLLGRALMRVRAELRGEMEIIELPFASV